MKKLYAFLILLSAFYQAKCLPKSYNQPTGTSDLIMIRSNIYLVQSDSSTVLLDGDMTQYESDFSNNLDSLDIRKMSNFSENLGMPRANTMLVVERRKTIAYADTIFFKLWNTHPRTYQFEFIATNMEQPGLSGYLEDLYLHTKTPISLNDSTYINFAINADPASANVSRFRIIFSTTAQLGVLPVTFTSVKAYQQNNHINIDWKTENESNLKQYIVEKSTDGIHFSNAFSIAANNTTVNNYSWVDNNPISGENYYRIQTIQIDGKIEYSQVLKVLINNSFSFIKVYPNPVEGNNINLLISNEPAGLYELRLFNQFGQMILQKRIKFTGGNGTQVIQPGQSIPRGIYQLEIIKPDGSMSKIGLIY